MYIYKSHSKCLLFTVLYMIIYCKILKDATHGWNSPDSSMESTECLELLIWAMGFPLTWKWSAWQSDFYPFSTRNQLQTEEFSASLNDQKVGSNLKDYPLNNWLVTLRDSKFLVRTGVMISPVESRSSFQPITKCWWKSTFSRFSIQFSLNIGGSRWFWRFSGHLRVISSIVFHHPLVTLFFPMNWWVNSHCPHLT